MSIIKRNKHRNIFLYADPFGIKHLQYEIFSELAQNPNSVELLINFNSFGFIREGCRLLNVEIDDELNAYEETEISDNFQNNIENMNRIANGEYWQEIILLKKRGSITAKQAEELFVDAYMENLGHDFEYIFQFAVKTGDNTIPKYRMIFATNHIQGALYMSETMIKCNNEMTLDNHGQQESLFDYEFTRNSCADDILDILKKACDDEASIDCKDLCMLTYLMCGPKYLHIDIRKALIELEKRKLIVINRVNKYTPTGKLSKSMDFIKNEISNKGRLRDEIDKITEQATEKPAFTLPLSSYKFTNSPPMTWLGIRPQQKEHKFKCSFFVYRKPPDSPVVP